MIHLRDALKQNLLSIGLHCKWLSLETYSSKVQFTSKSVSIGETDSLSITSSKFVDSLTNWALIKQLAIADGKTKFQEFLAITIRGTKEILVTAEYKGKNK